MLLFSNFVIGGKELMKEWAYRAVNHGVGPWGHEISTLIIKAHGFGIGNGNGNGKYTPFIWYSLCFYSTGYK